MTSNRETASSALCVSMGAHQPTASTGNVCDDSGGDRHGPMFFRCPGLGTILHCMKRSGPSHQSYQYGTRRRALAQNNTDRISAGLPVRKAQDWPDAEQHRTRGRKQQLCAAMPGTARAITVQSTINIVPGLWISMTMSHLANKQVLLNAKLGNRAQVPSAERPYVRKELPLEEWRGSTLLLGGPSLLCGMLT